MGTEITPWQLFNKEDTMNKLNLNKHFVVSLFPSTHHVIKTC
uniref:Uncharacterized protein n=1 Tax=Anguilla anguilla TaxID=7936 RepID=A0A0E9UGD5_ANGAN